MLSEELPLAAELAGMEQDAIRRLSRAWVGFGGGPTPDRIETIRAPRHDGKSVVFRLGRVGSGAQGVVAKELLAEAASVELNIYREILPQLPMRGPELIGWIDSSDHERVWLFLEEIDGPPYDKTDPDHVAIASRWLAALHAATSNGEFDGLLPERGPEYYSSLAGRTIIDLEDVSNNAALDLSQSQVLRRLSQHLSRLLRSSDSFGDLYDSLPLGLVHGDFKGNNMAFSSRVGLGELRVFDWSESHLGPLAIDTWWVDPHVYRTALETAGLVCRREDLDVWRRFGAVVRWLSAASWEMPRLHYEWVERPMRRMSLYETRLRSALGASPWLR